MEQPNAENHNELELKLAATLAGDLPGDEFIQYLLNAQIFMPIRDEASAIKGFQRSTKAQPLIVEDEDGLQILVLFTSPARARICGRVSRLQGRPADRIQLGVAQIAGPDEYCAQSRSRKRL